MVCVPPEVDFDTNTWLKARSTVLTGGNHRYSDDFGADRRDCRPHDTAHSTAKQRKDDAPGKRPGPERPHEQAQNTAPQGADIGDIETAYPIAREPDSRSSNSLRDYFHVLASLSSLPFPHPPEMDLETYD